MINIISATTYYFPVGIASDSITFKLSLYSDLSKHTTEFNVDANTSVSTDNYFPIIITQALIDMMPGGEYNYSLLDEDIQVSKGLLRITKDDDGEYNPAEDYVVYGVENEWITTNIEDGSALWQSGYTSGWTDALAISGGTFVEGYNSGWTDGYSSGYSEGYGEGYEDGDEDGYNEGVEDGFQEGYGSGYTDGVNSVPLTTTAFTDNGIFTASTGGWSAVTIDVPTGITVITITKEEYDILVSAGTINENAEYLISGYTDNYELGYASGWTDGYNTSSAGSYQSGFTEGYSSGYTSGKTDGYQSGWDDAMSISGETYNQGYQSGYTDGVASIRITSEVFEVDENGTHQVVAPMPNTAWSAITINVKVGKFDMPLAFMAGNNVATVEMTTYGNCRPNLEYSLDEENWNTWDYSTITLGAGEYVYFRGVNSRIGSSTYDYAKFSTTGTIYVGGNVMSLLDGMAATTSTTINQSYCFYKLFAGSTINLDENIPLKLPATTLASDCYNSMFMGCTSFRGEITLPAKSLPSGCYTSMFKNCTSFSNTASTIHLYATSRNATSLIDWLNNTSSSILNVGKIMNYGNVALQSADVSGWVTYKMQTYTPS